MQSNQATTILTRAARADLAALDALRPRVARLKRLNSRGNDTLIAIGSDLDAVSRLDHKFVHELRRISRTVRDYEGGLSF